MEIENINFDKLTPVITGFVAVIGGGLILLIAQSQMLITLCVFAVGSLILIFVSYVGGSAVLKLFERHNEVMFTRSQLIQAGVPQRDVCRTAPLRISAEKKELLRPQINHFLDTGKMIDMSGYSEPEAVIPNRKKVEIIDCTDADEYPQLSELVETLDRILVIAPQNSGKTTFLTYCLYQDQSKGGQSIVIDSHAEKGQWPEWAKVVGRGRNYPAIHKVFKAVIKELDRRYKLRGETSGEQFPLLNLYIDELFILSQNLDLTAEFVSLLSECRKINIRLIACGHSENAPDICLAGHSECKGGYQAIINLHHDIKKNERYAMVRMGEDRLNRNKKGVRYALPLPIKKEEQKETGGNKNEENRDGFGN